MPQVSASLPTQSDWPRPTCVVWCTASYVRVPDLDTMPERQTEKEQTCFSWCILVNIALYFTSPLKGDIKYKMHLSFCVQLWPNCCQHDSKDNRALTAVVWASGMMVVDLVQKQTSCKGSLTDSSANCSSSCQQQTRNLGFK